MALSGLWGCVTVLPSTIDSTEATGSLVVGRVIAILTGDTTRRYPPAVGFLELEHQMSAKRFQVDISSHDQHFAVDVPPGLYRLTRVQISEGPFRSMAELSMTFSVAPDVVTHVGTWRFRVDSPRYGRMVVVSVGLGEGGVARSEAFLNGRYPTVDRQSMVEALPQPTQMKTRLYEVMPYPRYPRYFRRHWW